MTTLTVACQPPLSMEFSRQELLGGGLPFTPPGILPYTGMEPMSPALAGGFFTTEALGKPLNIFNSESFFCFHCLAKCLKSSRCLVHVVVRILKFVRSWYNKL